MKNAWKEHGKTTQESASRELSCPQEEEFFPEHQVSPLETNSEANAAWPDGRMGEAQCDHLGDALMPRLRAYKPDGLLVRVQGDALALMSQFSSVKDSFRAAAECMSELSCDNEESDAAESCLSFAKPNPHGVQYKNASTRQIVIQKHEDCYR